MSDAEWLAGTDPTEMCWFLRDQASDRKFRLLIVACGRRARPQIGAAKFVLGVDATERFCEGTATEEEIRQFNLSRPNAAAVAVQVMRFGQRHAEHAGPQAEAAAQLALLRDIFGNSFRSIAQDPEWLTSTAVALARGMYEARDFSAMPILADALQDAGCDNEAVLEHCRGPGPHVRGCWVVDLILGRS
ncbi:Uncharacterized protein OS=uncultured bacterium PE=4 SV=1 [Gemmataceae bacterium]|nr:Uncharacterized protein OS=uncultured bacterium PE=4 SV=1 [Gemmataceae bacterium]VTU02413.1 Uncharacterized protein OS=uncultured bacterium PE=4 SV=1 [Gemmataceae bacterium]